MKKILSVLLTLCLFVNVSFAFDPYADEEVEKKSYKKLYYGIALTLLGGFLAYDGFSEEEVDVSKPRVDFLTVSHSEYVQISDAEGETEAKYELRSGISLNNVPGLKTGDYTHYDYDNNGDPYLVEKNILYNNGNVDLRNITIEVRYSYGDGTYIRKNGDHISKDGYDIQTGEYLENQGYHVAGIKGIKEGEVVEGAVVDHYEYPLPDEPTHREPVYILEGDERAKTYTYKDENCTELKELKKGEHITWQDIWSYTTTESSSPNGSPREGYFKNDQGVVTNDGTAGLHLGKDSATLMEVRVKLKKNINYTPIYEKRHKSDLEGVAGIFVGLAGIYFIVDHFVDLHKFNVYAKKHSLNLRFATVSNGYKLMLQKRI